VVVWIGDNSAHPLGSSKNLSIGSADIIQFAREKGVTIHSVVIEGGGGEVEQALHRKQCEEISFATGGQIYNLQDAQRIATEITKAVRCEQLIVGRNHEEFQQLAAGELAPGEYLRTNDRGELERRYKFVRLLKSAGVDLEKLPPGVPTFSRGWVATQLPGGQPMFQRMVYVSRVELDVLLGELNFLVSLLHEDGTRGTIEAFRLGLSARVGIDSFFSNRQDGDIPFDVFLSARGIPLRTGITMKTRDEILAMTPGEKRLLQKRLTDVIIPNLTNARGNSNFTLAGGFDFGWIPENTLP
jgi:hypothetical protein